MTKKLLKTLLPLLALPALASIETLDDTTAHVYCSDKYHGRWAWIHENEIEGQWIEVVLSTSTTKLFLIDKFTYEKLKDQCTDGYVRLPYPRPAENIFTAWYSFAYYDDSGMLHVPDSFDVY